MSANELQAAADRKMLEAREERDRPYDGLSQTQPVENRHLNFNSAQDEYARRTIQQDSEYNTVTTVAK